MGLEAEGENSGKRNKMEDESDFIEFLRVLKCQGWLEGLMIAIPSFARWRKIDGDGSLIEVFRFRVIRGFIRIDPTGTDEFFERGKHLDRSRLMRLFFQYFLDVRLKVMCNSRGEELRQQLEMYITISKRLRKDDNR